MRRVNDLHQTNAMPHQVKMVDEFFNTFKSLNKKPYKVNRTNLRMHVKGGYYVEYSCATGKWQFTHDISKTWYHSESASDFLEAATERVRQFKEKDYRNKSLNDHDFFFLGRFKGLRVSQIRTIDPDYHQWMVDQGICCPAVSEGALS